MASANTIDLRFSSFCSFVNFLSSAPVSGTVASIRHPFTIATNNNGSVEENVITIAPDKTMLGCIPNCRFFFGDEHGFFVDLRLCHFPIHIYRDTAVFYGYFSHAIFLGRDNLECAPILLQVR